MPCYDNGPWPENLVESKPSKVDAMLCAVWGAIPDVTRKTLLTRIKWDEAGVTEDEFLDWVIEHTKQDIKRMLKS